MPVGFAIECWAAHMGEQRLEERQLMQAADDGMPQPYSRLDQIAEHRAVLSWYRNDPAKFAEDFCGMVPMPHHLRRLARETAMERLGKRYSEALGRSQRDTKYSLTVHILDGWTVEQHRHWVDTGESP